MSTKTEVLAQLNALVDTGNVLSESFNRVPNTSIISYQSSESETSHRAFYTSAVSAIARISGEDSEYYHAVPELPAERSLVRPGSYPSFIPAVTGALIALRDSVKSGYLESIESRLTANVHDDLLEQARTLLTANYHVAAIVIAGGVLENHLRKLATDRGLSWSGSGSISKYNDLLKENAYPQPIWRRIQSVADVRNDAAHGNANAVVRDDVADAIGFILRVITDHPA